MPKTRSRSGEEKAEGDDVRGQGIQALKTTAEISATSARLNVHAATCDPTVFISSIQNYL